MSPGSRVMFVVNTTSATVGSEALANSCPRKRVPSSRRRNPGDNSGGPLGVRASWSAELDVVATSRRRRGLNRQHVRVRLCRSRAPPGPAASVKVWSRIDGGAAARDDEQRQQEREPEEEPTAPPADLRQQVAGLTCAEDGVRRAGDAAEARGESAALSGLQQDGGDENHAVDHEQREKDSGDHLEWEVCKLAKHLISLDLRRPVKRRRWRPSSRRPGSPRRREARRRLPRSRGWSRCRESRFRHRGLGISAASTSLPHSVASSSRITRMHGATRPRAWPSFPCRSPIPVRTR